MFHGKFVFYTSMPHAGATFILPVLNHNPDVCTIMLSDEFFFRLAEKSGADRTRQNGIRIYYQLLAKATEDMDKVYPQETAVRVLDYLFPVLCPEPFFPQAFIMRIRSLKKIRLMDIIIAVYYARMLSEGRKFDEQSAVLVFDAHSRADAAFRHRRILEQFDDLWFLSTVRNPLYTTASSIKGGHYCSKEIMLHLLRPCFFDYAQSFPEEWKQKFLAVRFEDGKLHPVETFTELGKTISFPFSYDMLSSDEEGISSRGYPVRGFDTEPVKRSLNDVFSKNDEDYLTAVFEKLMLQYHYISSSPPHVCPDTPGLFGKAFRSFDIPVSRPEFIEVLETVRSFSDSTDNTYFFPKLIEI